MRYSHCSLVSDTEPHSSVVTGAGTGEAQVYGVCLPCSPTHQKHFTPSATTADAATVHLQSRLCLCPF